MFRWLNGPGAVFRDPLPGSTHYLSAYDKDGHLIRLKPKRNQEAGEDETTGIKKDKHEDENDEVSEENTRRSDTTRSQAVPDEQAEDLAPFPMNRNFRSQPVLSEELKDEIWKRIMVEGQSIRVVSAALQVEMRRVGAVVRLKAVEKQWVEQVRCWICATTSFQFLFSLYDMMRKHNRLVLKTIPWLQIQFKLQLSDTLILDPTSLIRDLDRILANIFFHQGKRLAIPYAKAMLGMLPKTPYYNGIPAAFHEPINDLPVHRATLTQRFHPVAESRHFTRTDAGKVFARDLLPAEARIPHPELVEIEKLRHAGVEPKQRIEIVRDKMLAEEAAAEQRRSARAAREAKALTRVVPLDGQGRAEFRFRDITVESVGKDGRSRYGVGARYGVPPQDRKRGIIKIPTRVEL